MPNSDLPHYASLIYPNLNRYVHERIAEFDRIPDERKGELKRLAEFIAGKREQKETALLTFICTHNSRRSHLSQIWAQIAAEVYGLSGVKTYSGGTEATAFNPRAVAALQRCGVGVETREPEASNPRYVVRASESGEGQVCFSKVFNEPPNPTDGYCAVMTCSQADDACPIVMGCELRLPIRYEDPKVADDTDQETARYDERCRQICREMLYAMSLIA